MLSPDEHARVEQMAMYQALARAKHAVELEYMPTLAPWFQTAQGRPIWLTPADRAFLKGHRISDR